MIVDVEERAKLRALGYDPDNMEEVGQEVDPSVLNSDQQNPVKTTPPTESTSTLGVAAKSAGRNLIPSLGALGIANLVGAGLTASGVGAPIGIPAMLISGAIAAHYIKKGQDAVVNNTPLADSFLGAKQEAIDQQEHPYASLAGSLVPQALALRPSIEAPIAGFKAFAKLPTGASLSAAEINAAKNLAIAAGTAPAMEYTQEAYNQGTLAPKLDPTSLVANTLAGAVLSKPTKLGEALGFHNIPENPNKDSINSQQATRAQKSGETAAEFQAANQATENVAKRFGMSLDDFLNLDANTKIDLIKQHNEEERQFKAEMDSSDYAIKKQKESEAASELEKQKAQEKQAKVDDYEANKQFKIEQEADAAERLKEQQRIEAEKIKAENDKLTQVRTEDFQKAKIEELSKELPDKTVKPIDYLPKEPLTTETGKEIHPDYTGNLETDALLNEKTPMSEAERIQDEYDRGIRKQDASEIKKGLEEKGITKLSPSMFLVNKFKKLGSLRNIKVESDGTLSENGKPIAGNSALRQGLDETLVKFNPTKAKLDTIPHELTHVFVQDLFQNGSKSEKKLAQRAYDRIGASDDFKQWQSNLPETSSYKNLDKVSQVDEFMAKHVGEDTVRRIFQTDDKGNLKNWVSDVWANVKHKFNKATPEDYSRIFSNKLLNDAPFSERATEPTNVKSGDNKNQDESNLKGEAPVTYRGKYDRGEGKPPLHIYDLTSDIEDHPKGSTVSEKTLKDLGYSIPKELPQALTKNQEDSAFDVEKKKRQQELNAEFNAKMNEQNQINKQIIELKNKPTRELGDDITLKSLMEKHKDIGDELQTIVKRDESLTKPIDKNFKTDVSRNQDESSLARDEKVFRPDQVNDGFGLKLQTYANTKEGQKLVSADNLIGRLRNLYPDEWAMMKDKGLEKFLNKKEGKVSGFDVDEWIKKHGPKVEVKKLDAVIPKQEYSPEYKAAQEIKNRIQHELIDNLDSSRRLIIKYAYADSLREISPDVFQMDEPYFKDLVKARLTYGGEDALSQSELNQIIKYYKANNFLANSKESINERSNDSATRSYDIHRINPKPLDKMEGAVDLLVKLPFHGQPHYSSDHYPKNGGDLLAHVRGNMETTPDGRKVFHVFELQSDWAQALRKGQTRDAEPLLKHYEKLALKAAIDHAIKEGADSIAISDADTAMLTERHDQFSGEIKQEGGMRLHYDKTLPKIAESLTGEKGTPIDFGEHRNAANRNDLVFKNPDGTFNKNITALEYPLAKAKETIERKGGIPLIGNKLNFQEDSIFDSPEPKLVDKESEKLASTSPVPPQSIPSVEVPDSKFSLGFIKPEIDKIYDLKNPEATKVADGLGNFFDKYTLNIGKFVNEFNHNVRQMVDLDSVVKAIIKNPKNYIEQDTQQLRNVRDWFWAKQDGKELPTLSEDEQLIKNEIVKFLKAVRSELIKRPGIREVEGYNEDYIPNVMDARVIREILNNPYSQKSLQLKKDFIDYQVSKNPKAGGDATKAAKMFDTFLSGWKKQDINIADQFGPLDKAAGIGLPESWRNPNLLDTMNKYLNRTSRRFAYHDAIELPEGTIEALDKLKSNKSVAAVLRDVTGNRIHDEPALETTSGLIRAFLLGPKSGIQDFTTGMFLGAQHHSNPVQFGINTLKSALTLKDNLAGVMASGRIRQHMNSLELDSGFDDILSGLRRTRDIISDLNTRNWWDKIARSVAYGQGRLATLDFLEAHNNGKLNRTGKDWFDNFGKDVDWKKGDLTPEELSKIAARYVDSVQGTYDYRGLPRQAVDSQIAPFLKLSLWNVEKSNNFIKYTVDPLLKGNPKPALMTTLGLVLGGAATQQLIQALTKRKQKTASIDELKEANAEGQDIKMATFYKLSGLASAAGHLGILGDMTKGALDLTYGKSRPQVYNNILMEAASNVIATTANLVNAINEDGFSPDLIVKGISKILEDNAQGYRLVLAHFNADKKEDIEKANKFRDLRVFNMLHGNKIVDLRSQFSDTEFDRPDIKDFKKTDNVQEAAQMLPNLIKKAFEDSKGSPEKLKKELQKIRENSYQTMPNPETMPDSFAKYLLFLRKTQGEDVAKERLVDYIKKNTINQVKSSMLDFN